MRYSVDRLTRRSAHHWLMVRLCGARGGAGSGAFGGAAWSWRLASPIRRASSAVRSATGTAAMMRDSASVAGFADNVVAPRFVYLGTISIPRTDAHNRVNSISRLT